MPRFTTLQGPDTGYAVWDNSLMMAIVKPAPIRSLAYNLSYTEAKAMAKELNTLGGYPEDTETPDDSELGENGLPRIYSEPDSQEPDIIPIPDLRDWPDSVLTENLAIYKAEAPDRYIEARIAELEAEIERRRPYRVARYGEPSDLPADCVDGTLSVLSGVGCPPLTIQFGEVGGLRLDTAIEVGAVMAAIGNALDELGHRELAEHIRKLWLTGIAPLVEAKNSNG